MLAPFLDVQIELDRIRKECEKLRRSNELFLAETSAETKEAYGSMMALVLHGVYAGVERILRDIIRYFDGQLPVGSDWHAKLLVRACNPNPGVREAVISEGTAAELANLKNFRHLVRGIYQSSLDFDRVFSMSEHALKLIPTVINDIGGFMNKYNEPALSDGDKKTHSGESEAFLIKGLIEAIRNNDENNASMNLFLIEKKVHPKRFAEILERVDIDGVTIKPLDLALQLGHDKVADVLLKYGAKDATDKTDPGLFMNKSQGD